MAEEILPDDLALRTGRRERALAQMEAHDLDVLVLGRQANVRYVTGAPQLWVAGTRPFAPICVVVRATGEIHLNSSWDEGIPEEIGHDHLYGLAWNPMTLIEVLKGIDGAATARRVGTDAMSPTFAPAAADRVPQRRARRRRGGDEGGAADQDRRRDPGPARRARASPSAGSPQRCPSSRPAPPSRR